MLLNMAIAGATRLTKPRVVLYVLGTVILTGILAYFSIQNVYNESLRSAPGVQNIIATETNAQQVCNSKGACNYSLYADYTVNATQENNILVAHSDNNVLSTIHILINPSHPDVALDPSANYTGAAIGFGIGAIVVVVGFTLYGRFMIRYYRSKGKSTF
jgi:hypothetical protein